MLKRDIGWSSFYVLGVCFNVSMASWRVFEGQFAFAFAHGAIFIVLVLLGFPVVYQCALRWQLERARRRYDATRPELWLRELLDFKVAQWRWICWRRSPWCLR